MRPGRSNLLFSAPNTRAGLDIGGLQSWQSADRLAAYSPDADMWWSNLGAIAPMQGATRLQGTIRNDQNDDGDGGVLLQSDALVIQQLHTRQIATDAAVETYVAAIRTFIAPVTELDGMGVLVDDVAGGFTSTPSAPFSIDVRASAWDAAADYNGDRATLLNPNAVELPIYVGTGFLVSSVPGGSAYGFIGKSANLAYGYVQNDTVLANITYDATTPSGDFATVIPAIASSSCRSSCRARRAPVTCKRSCSAPSSSMSSPRSSATRSSRTSDRSSRAKARR